MRSVGAFVAQHLQPGLCLAPFALHRAAREPQRLRGFLLAHACEESALGDLDGSWPQRRQLGQSPLQLEHLGGVECASAGRGRLIQCAEGEMGDAAAALAGEVSAGVIHHDLAHRGCRDRAQV